MDLNLGTLAAHIRKDWKEQVDRFMNEMRQTAWSREHRKKPYVTAVILAVLIVAEIFILSGILGYLFGTAGVVLHEIVLALIGVLMILIMRGRMKTAFPFRKLKWSGIFGSLILWGGILLLTSVVTLTMAYFFPDQMLNASNGVEELMSATPMWIDLLVVAVTPAICEEIAFRGALLTCFRGTRSKWTGIIIVGLFFGACHGSVWRMVPTAILGLVMGYVLFETENIFYCMLIHFTNNAFSVILTNALVWLERLQGTGAQAVDVATDRLPLASVGIYMIFATIAPLLLYIGDYLIHRGQPGYTKVFPREKRGALWGMLGACAVLFGCGVFLISAAVVLQVMLG